MNLEKQESREEELRLEKKRIEEADSLIRKERTESEEGTFDLMRKAGKSAYAEILSTRRSDAWSGGKNERDEFAEWSAPHLAEYEKSIEAAKSIGNADDRKKALEKAYLSLVEKLEGVRGTQEGRDAENDKRRKQDEKKTAEDIEHARKLEFSKAVLKAAQELETERRTAEIARGAEARAKLSANTERESVESARKAAGELKMIA